MRPAWTEGGLREMRAGSARALPAREVRPGSDPPALPSAPYPGFAAGLLKQLDLRDRHAALDGLHHVVDGQGRDRGGGERLHLDAGLVHGAHARLDGQLAAAQVVAERDVHTGDAQRMAERDELGGALGAQDAGGARDAEDVALDRKSTRLNSSHVKISYAVFCLKKKKKKKKRKKKKIIKKK